MRLWILAAAFAAFALTWAPPARADAAPGAIGAAPERNKVSADTVIVIEIAEHLASKTSKRGDIFAIRLAEPIRLGDEVLIPAGVKGKGQVVDVGRAGIGGKPAKLVLAARYLDWNGRRMPLKAFRWAQSGDDRANEALALGVALGVVGIFVRGGEIEVPPGAQGFAKLAEDVVPSSISRAAATSTAQPSLDQGAKN